ncbi:MAG TPA: hypothetical protein VKX49_21260 [Bryobacteraceae bacterium]|nr:hypothetical protein [Bryobacteraceae bacterium]
MPAPRATEESHQVEALMQAVEELRRRVAALEQWSVSIAPGSPSVPQPAPVALPAAVLPDVSPGIVAVLGRLLLGVAGAYLLRAITEASLVPQLAGAILGLLYAGGWLIASVRISAGNRLSVAMHGITAAAIVAPLLWEATVRFHIFPPAASAAALAVFIIMGQVLAWRRDHSMLAGVTAFAGCATAVALIIATLDPVPFAVALTFAAAIVEFGSWRDHALSWRWIVALACDFCAFLLAYLVTRPQGLPEGYAPVTVTAAGALLIALPLIYVASTAARTLARGLAIRPFEILQIATAAALAIGGGLRIAHGTGWLPAIIIAACLIFGVACYFVAFTGLAAARNFHACATFALLLILAGGALYPSGGAPLWMALALAGAAVTRPVTTPIAHAAVYLFAAATASGLSLYAAGQLTALFQPGRLTLLALLCAASTAFACSLTLRFRTPKQTWMARIPAALVALNLCWSVTGLAAGLLSRAHLDAPLASTCRTALIAMVAIALAWFGSRKNLRELIWLLFPWMFFGAFKLISEDFQQGRSATLFLSLLVYGGTLIALPRLLRRDSMRT